MKRKQVIAMLLALSMAAANVVTAPVDAYARISVAEGVGSLGTEDGTKTTVTLAAAVEDEAKIYISAEDVAGNETVTIKPDGSAYEKIKIGGESAPSAIGDFTETSVVLNSETFADNKAAATLYLLPKDATDLDGMISVTVSIDKTAPAITSVKVADSNALESALYLKAANPTLSVEAEDGATVTYALGDSEKDQAALKAFDASIDGKVTGGSAELTMADADKKYIYIKAEDAVGNASYACTKLVTIDATAPTLKTLTAAESDATSDVTVGTENPALVLEADADTTDVTISYAVGKETKAEGELKEVQYQTYDSEKGAKLTLANGASTYVYVKLADQAGNEKYVCSGKITVDTSAPDCTLTAAPAATENGAVAIQGEENAFNIDKGDVKVSFEPATGDTVTAVTVDEANDNSAVSNQYVTLSTAGEHTIKVTLKHTANNKTADKTITVKCYKQVDVSAASGVSKTFGDALAVTDLYQGLNANYKDAAPTTVYLVNDANSEDDVKEQFGDATAGLPADAGTYWIKTTFPAKGYFLENSVYTKLTISKKSGVTAAYNGTVTVQYSDTTGKTVDLADTVKQYNPANDTLTYTVGAITGDGSGSVAALNEGSVITVKGNDTDPGADKDATISVTVSGFKNYDDITVNISVKVTQNAVAELEIIGAENKTYDGVAETVSCKIDGMEAVESVTGLTITISGKGNVIKDAGTYTITASFSGTLDGEEKTGYATKEVTISKRPLTVTFANTEVTEGTDPANVTYPAAPTYTGLADGQTAVTTSAITLSSDYTADAKAGAAFTYTGCPEKTGFKITAGDDTDLAGNYDITVQNGSVIVKAAPATDPGTPTGPSDPSYSGGTSGGASGGTTTDQKDNDKDQNQTDTGNGTVKITTNDNGENVIVDANGKLVTNDIVKIDGAKYIADENGVVLKKGFATTPSGNLVYAGDNGKIKMGQTFTADGKKYVAKKSGAIVTKAFATTEKGNKVYCSKTGAIVTNKVFKVGGKKYVAKKSGALVRSAWVKVGNVKYYCNKNGVVTKTKK